MDNELKFPFYTYEQEHEDWDILTRINEDLTYISITYDRVLGIFSLYIGSEALLDEDTILNNINQDNVKTLFIKALEAIQEIINIAV